MKTMKLIALSVLVFLLNTSFINKTPKTNLSKETLLILKDPMDKESFSKFMIQEESGIFIATNTQTDDYPVSEGIYRVEGASNDRFYHKRVVVVK
jgi:hypothetical protein